MKTSTLLLLACLPVLSTSIGCASADAEDGQGDDDVTEGTGSAKLLTETYKTTVTARDGAKCVYNFTYAKVLAPVASLSPNPTSGSSSGSTSSKVVIGKFLNSALHYGDDQVGTTCKEPGGMKLTGGYTKASVNASNVLSVLYTFDAEYGSGVDMVRGTVIHPTNLNLVTGKPIALSDILTDAGKTALIAGCEKKLTALMTQQELPGTMEYANACKGAITVRGTHKTEDFTIVKEGIRVHIGAQLSYENSPIAGDGYLVKWAALGTGLKSGSPVKGLAGR